MKIDLKKMSQYIAYRSKILFRGFLKTLFGAFMTALMVAGCYGLFVVPKEGGYVAVGDFLASVCIINIAIGGMYFMGRPVKKGAKK